MMQQVKAPRSVFLNFPLGRTCGKPDQPQMQREIITAALQFLESATQPGDMLDLPYDWGEPSEPVKVQQFFRQRWISL